MLFPGRPETDILGGAMKIITVLKDDSPDEILELFREAPAGEVIFVLPKKCKAFSAPAHFAAIASEASATGKVVSVMAADTAMAKLASDSGILVMSAEKPKRGRPSAKLAAQPPPADEDVQDFSDDAFQDDVVVPSDERMNVVGIDEKSEESEEVARAGMHVEGEGGADVDENADGIPDKLTEEKAEELVTDDDAGFIASGVQASHAALAAAMDGMLKVTRRQVKVPVPKPKATDVPVHVGTDELIASNAPDDYIDKVWRDRTQSKADPVIMTRPPTKQRLGPRLGGHMPRSVVIGLLILAAVLLGVGVYTVTGSSTIVIVPTSSAIDVSLTVQASDVFGSVDPEFLKLPGQRFSIEGSASATEAATGSRDVASKARGTITVTNEYSTAPQTLIATTRFVDEDGHVFRTLQSVTVPGSTEKGGKIVAGTIDIGVIADKPGAEYNAEPGTFIIAAFKERNDTERMQKLYGVSTAAMTGGANGPSAVVTQENYDVAVAAAQAAVQQKVKEALSAQAPGMRVLDEQGLTWNPLTVSARPDDAATDVTVTADGTLTTIAFRQSDLDDLIQRAVMQQQRVVVVPEQMTIEVSNALFDADTGILGFTIRILGPGYAPIDPEQVITDVVGKKSAAIRAYFSQNEDIQSATLELSPPWVRSVPTNRDKVDVQISYEQSGS